MYVNESSEVRKQHCRHRILAEKNSGLSVLSWHKVTLLVWNSVAILQMMRFVKFENIIKNMQSLKFLRWLKRFFSKSQLIPPTELRQAGQMGFLVY